MPGFYVLGCDPVRFPMQPVPQRCQDEASDITDCSGDGDQHQRDPNTKRADHVYRLDHVDPENEIDDRLRLAERDNYRPNAVPGAEHRSKDETCFVGVKCLHKSSLLHHWQDNGKNVLRQ